MKGEKKSITGRLLASINKLTTLAEVFKRAGNDLDGVGLSMPATAGLGELLECISDELCAAAQEADKELDDLVRKVRFYDEEAPEIETDGTDDQGLNDQAEA
jgi:hypothetical protein